MLKKIFFSIFIFIILFNLYKTSQAIIIPLKFFYNNTIINNETSLINNLYNSYLYTYIQIGEPQYKIKTFISLFTSHFYISPTLISINDKNISNYYHINKSSTFQNISCLNRYYVLSKWDIEAKEKFIINGYNLENKSISEIILNDFDFALGIKNNFEENNSSEIYCLTIGLKQMMTYRDRFNFIFLLKEKNIIRNYNWFIMFENKRKKNDEIYKFDEFINVEPKLIIGDVPHNYMPNIFSEDKLVPSHLTNYYWLIYFNNIYYYKNKNDSEYNSEKIKKEILYRQAQIYLDKLIIIAPDDYFSNIKIDFFMEYISKNICHLYNNSEIDSFYCDKSDKFNVYNLKLFPILYFEHKEFNYTFELSYQDLFIEKDNKYYFLICKENSYNDNWFFNYIFLRKYQLVFNQDTKLISLYTQNLNIENENDNLKEINNNGSLRILSIILITLSWILFIGLGFLIGRYIYKKYDKKKRANELDDHYEYISEKNIN